MGCTRAEFMAHLARVAGTAPVCGDHGALRIVIANGTLDITLQEQPARRIGAISLPVLGVDFRFRGVDQPARDAFLARFDLYTRRGGG